MRLLLTITVSSMLAGAQTLPASGVIVDQVGRAIRQVVATADAAQAGSAKVREFDLAAASPDGRNALVARRESLYVVRRLDGALPVWREMADKIDVARAVWSENSDAAAVIDKEKNRLDLWAGMAHEPRRKGAVDLTSVEERIVSVAVDDEARYAFLTTQGKQSGTLYLVKPGQEPLMVMPLGRAGVIRLAGGALYLADRGRNEVLKMTNWEGMPNVTALASAGQGVEDPVGFAVDVEKKLLYVASGGTRQVLTIDTRSMAVKEALELDFIPTRLERIGAGPLFALNGLESGAPLLDTRSPHAALVPVNQPSGD
ncbi:MAG: hypothetical protein HY821_17120 [Acidobacteria bacterium]|nr:hypothetical protein [Acidobacteriota bacterium]